MRRRFNKRRYRRRRLTTTVIFVFVVMFVIVVIAYGAFKKRPFIVRRFKTAIRADWRRFVKPPPQRYSLPQQEEAPPEYRRANDLVASAFRAVDEATPPQPQHIQLLQTAIDDLKEAERLLSREATEQARRACDDIRRKMGEAFAKLATIQYRIALDHYERAGFGAMEKQFELRLAFNHLKEARRLLAEAKGYLPGDRSLTEMENEVNRILYDVQKRLGF